jgi:hypothetical protein
MAVVDATVAADDELGDAFVEADTADGVGYVASEGRGHTYGYGWKMMRTPFHLSLLWIYDPND